MEPGPTYQVDSAPLAVMQGGTEERQARASLYAKMAQVLSGITRIPKLGYNEHFRYAFATESDITDSVRGLLAEFGLCLFVSMEDVQQWTVQQANGKDALHTQVLLQVSLCDTDTGVCWISAWRGEAQDGQDKGITKATTSALKYFLLKTFLISTGNPADDPDSDVGQTRQSSRAPRRSPAQRPNPNPAPKGTPPAPKPKPASSEKTGDVKAVTVGPTEFYSLAKSPQFMGAGKKFANEAAVKTYLEGFKAGDGYDWQAAISGLA